MRVVGIVVLAGLCAAVRPALVRSEDVRPEDGAIALEDAVSVVPSHDPCLRPAAVRARLAEWLGTDRVESGLSMELRVTDPVELVLRRRSGDETHRRFDVLPERCRERLDAVTLAGALAIDHTILDRLGRDSAGRDPAGPDAGAPRNAPTATDAGAPRNAPTTADAGAPRNAPTTADAGAPRNAPANARPSRGDAAREPVTTTALFAGLGALSNVVPGWVLQVGGGVELRFGRHVALRGSALWTTEAGAPLGNGEALYELVGGRLDLCGGGPVGGLVAHGCAGIASAELGVRGRGFDEDERARQAWVGVLVGSTIAYPLAERFRLGIRVDGVVPLRRPAVHVSDEFGRVLDSRELPPLGLGLALEGILTL